MLHSEDERASVENVLDSGFIEHNLLEAAGNCPMTAPMAWWGGPLNVEQLAARSVGLVCSALNALADPPLRAASATVDVAAAFAPSAHLRIAGEKTQGFAPHSGFYRTVDGWIRTHANYPHHENALKSGLGVSSGSDIADALAALPANDAQERIVAAGGVAALVRSRQDVAQLCRRQGGRQWALGTVQHASTRFGTVLEI